MSCVTWSLTPQSMAIYTGLLGPIRQQLEYSRITYVGYLGYSAAEIVCFNETVESELDFNAAHELGRR